MASADRAHHDTGRLPILGREVLVVDPVNAQGAFLHDAFVGVELARAIGASPGAEFAADADRLVDEHDAVLGTLVGGARRTHRDTRRLLAMQTGFREMDRPRALPLALLEGMDAVEPDTPRVLAIGVEIGQRPHVTARVPLLAGRGTSVAADADVEIDDEPKLLLACTWLWQ